MLNEIHYLEIQVITSGIEDFLQLQFHFFKTTNLFHRTLLKDGKENSNLIAQYDPLEGRPSMAITLAWVTTIGQLDF